MVTWYVNNNNMLFAVKGEKVDADELAEDAEANVEEKEQNKVSKNQGFLAIRPS